MTINDFAAKVAAEICNRLPEDYQGGEVQIEEMRKNNETLTGLLISKPGQLITPCIYLDDFFEHWDENGGDFTLDELVSRIISFRLRYVMPEIKAEDLTNYDRIKDKILPRFISADNSEYLKDKIYRIFNDFADIAVVYYIYVDNVVAPDGSKGTWTITRSAFKDWNIPIQELHETAVKNIRSITKPCIADMVDKVREIMANQGLSPEEIDEQCPEDTPRVQFVLMNELNSYGAATVLDNEFMDEVLDKIGTDKVYIMPSNIHDLVIMPADLVPISVDEIYQQVCELNKDLVPGDKLTNAVYAYSKDTGFQKIA